MQRNIRYTMLKYIQADFAVEKSINPLRIYELNNNQIKDGIILYLCEREIRVKDNFALNYALQKSKELNLELKIIHPQKKYSSMLKQEFINKQLLQTKEQFLEIGIDINIIEGNIHEYLNKLKIGLLIIDFNPILKREELKKLPVKVVEIDGHNIIPARFISDKQEYSAGTIRRKIFLNIEHFLTEFDNSTYKKTEADYALDDFIKNRLSDYAKYKNDFEKNVLSELSKYLNLGFLSSQRTAIEVIKSSVDDINKEVFLEEIIVRKELADNFCLFCEDFKSFSCVPNWARESLNAHETDLRTYTYSLSELENSQTHDRLWNAAQNQLKKEGVIHGYLRMYWAKKIAEWAQSPKQALDFAIYLNDKYAFDAPSPNGYTGILWSIGGLHDKPFRNWFITGKIRRMSYDSIKRKFDIEKYINFYS